MNKIFFCVMAAGLSLQLASCRSGSQSADVTWQVVEHRLNADGNAEYLQRFVVKNHKGNLSKLCFNEFEHKMVPVDPADTVVRIIPGYYYVASDRFATDADSIVIDLVTSGTCPQYSFGADGVHGVDKSGKPFDVKFTRLRNNARPEQWAVPGGYDGMPYADEFFDINEGLAKEQGPLGAYDIVPSFKSVKGGKGICRNPKVISETIVADGNPELYRIDVTADGVRLEGASENALRTARRTLKRLADANPYGLPLAVIEDYPDFGYRGLMLDVVRNFRSLDEVKKIVDLMADYRLNRLQFHIVDDEAWRLEIPGLPELTDYASRRGFTTDESEYLAQIYTGNGNPDGPANHGSYSRKEFIDFLRYCNDRGVLMIPEIETPGHARAAVKAMEARYRRTGDDTYRLREDGDTSVYRSAQDFNDNVMNPALPGPYKFMDKVIDEVIAMYKEAGVPLESFHIGGDEVPRGAWSGSPSAQKFMKEKGMTAEHELHAYWVREMAKAIAARGYKFSGWQDIGIGHSDEHSRGITPDVGFINLWISSPDAHGVRPGTKALDAGYPVLISASDNFYLDFAYNHHPDERGLTWGGVVDEFKSLDGYPAQIAPAGPDAKGRIVGVQGQLWAETMRSADWMESYLFPKMLGMAERAWNAEATYSHPKFNRVIEERELPALLKKNVNFHLRQPGIKLVSGKIAMNSPYRGAVIRYTLDGSEPTAKSPVYKTPISPDNAKEVRAKLYFLGKESVTSLLYLR